jgi:hypothetical protein
MNNWRESLDHPLFFLIVITIGVMSMSSLFTAGAKATGIHGVASLMQNP